MKKSFLTVLAVAMTLATIATASAGTIPQTLVEGGGGNQFSGDGNSTWLTWATNTAEHPRQYNARARLLAGGGGLRMNAGGTDGFAGDINGDTTEAVYQQTDGPDSDIWLYDLETESRSYPETVNGTAWEWQPSISDGYILFGRNKFARASSPWKIMLYDRNTDTLRVLDTVTNSCRCIFPGQVSDEYATWTRCDRATCQAWYYDIAGESTARIPNPLDKQQYFPSVSAATGDLYFIRSGNGCGQNVKLARWNPVGGGDAVIVSQQPAGYDVYSGPNVFDDTGGHQDVYVDRQVCAGKYYADIYVVNDADTSEAADRGPAARAPRSGTGKRIAVPGATPEI